VFDYERWKMHRSSGRYMRHVVGLLDSNILGGLLKPLAYVACVSMAVMAYNLLVEVGSRALRASWCAGGSACLGCRQQREARPGWHQPPASCHPARPCFVCPPVPVQAGKLPLWPILNVAANAPFGLTSFALSLLLVFR
jgi:hypothetical protein